MSHVTNAHENSGNRQILNDIRQSYKQKRDCLVHFLRLLAVCWPGAQSTRGNHALACNRAYSKEFFGVHNFKSSCMM